MSITTWIVVAAFAASMRSLATKDALGGPTSACMRTHASRCNQVYLDESISMNRLLSASGSAAPSTTAVAEMANREAQIAAASAASALNTETRTYLEHKHTMHLLPRRCDECVEV